MTEDGRYWTAQRALIQAVKLRTLHPGVKVVLLLPADLQMELPPEMAPASGCVLCDSAELCDPWGAIAVVLPPDETSDMSGAPFPICPECCARHNGEREQLLDAVMLFLRQIPA